MKIEDNLQIIEIVESDGSIPYNWYVFFNIFSTLLLGFDNELLAESFVIKCCKIEEDISDKIKNLKYE